MSDRRSTHREDKCGNCKAGKPCTGHKKDDKGAKYRLARGKDKPRGRLRRDEAPASQELSVLDYVKAAEGGFDHRSDAYIRGRLDAERIDFIGRGKACGASHIPANKKCSKTTTKASRASKKALTKEEKAERQEKAKKRMRLIQAGTLAATAAVSLAPVALELRNAQKARSRQRQQFKEWQEKYYQRRRQEWARGAGRNSETGRAMMRATQPERVTRNYKLLGIDFKYTGTERPPSVADTKAAWKRAARKNHPDMGGSTEKMAEINNAYNEINTFYKWWEIQSKLNKGDRSDAADWDVGPGWQWAREVRRNDTGRGKACGASHIPANKKCSKQTSTARTKRSVEPRNKVERKPLTPAQKALETRRLRNIEREILNEQASKATPRQLRKQLKENSYESWLRKNRISTKGKSEEQLNSIGRKWEKSEEGENFHRAAVALNRRNQREKNKKTVKKIGKVAALAGLTVGANVAINTPAGRRVVNRLLMRRRGL